MWQRQREEIRQEAASHGTALEQIARQKYKDLCLMYSSASIYPLWTTWWEHGASISLRKNQG